MTTEVRKRWFTQLASLTYPASPGQAAEAFKPYLAMFSDMTDEAFTRASLEFVVCSPRKMAIPSYDEIRKPLSSWWREHRPLLQALPAPVEPTRAPPTPEEIAAVSALTRQAKQYLTDSMASRNDGATKDKPPRAQYLSDGHLLTLYDEQAKLGGPLAGAAAVRAEMIRAKMLREMDTELMAHRERQRAEMAGVGT